jgi:hypothetical protein
MAQNNDLAQTMALLQMFSQGPPKRTSERQALGWMNFLNDLEQQQVANQLAERQLTTAENQQASLEADRQARQILAERQLANDEARTEIMTNPSPRPLNPLEALTLATELGPHARAEETYKQSPNQWEIIMNELDKKLRDFGPEEQLESEWLNWTGSPYEFPVSPTPPPSPETNRYGLLGQILQAPWPTLHN